MRWSQIRNNMGSFYVMLGRPHRLSLSSPLPPLPNHNKEMWRRRHPLSAVLSITRVRGRDGEKKRGGGGEERRVREGRRELYVGLYFVFAM